MWNKTLNSQLVDWGFTRLDCEYCVYYCHDSDGIVVVAIHVDDFFMLGSSKLSQLKFKEQLQTRWQISDGGPARFHIGITIEHDRANRTITLSQVALIDCIILQFGLSDTHPISTPLEPSLCLSKANSPQTNEEHADVAHLPYHKLIGSLMYLSIGTRPNIIFAVNHLCHFLDCFGQVHWEAAKWIVHYLKGSHDLRLVLGGEHTVQMLGYTDSDYASCPDTRHSTSRFCFSLSSGMVSWSSRQQKHVTLLTCKAEYIAASKASQELIWLRHLLAGLDLRQPTASPLLCDNNSAITLSSDPAFHTKLKHITNSSMNAFPTANSTFTMYPPKTTSQMHSLKHYLAAPSFASIRIWAFRTPCEEESFVRRSSFFPCFKFHITLFVSTRFSYTISYPPSSLLTRGLRIEEECWHMTLTHMMRNLDYIPNLIPFNIYIS